jgi:hypothetical protein
MYLEGIITLPKPDVEGGVYSVEDIDVEGLLQSGYLDVNHLMFEHGIKEAVIGRPVEVRRTKDGVWAKFELFDTPLARDVWNYAREHPKVLGFSIAGTLLKPLFDRGGKWLLGAEHGGSVAVARFPMNPSTWAVATSRAALAASTLRADQVLRVAKMLAREMSRPGFRAQRSFDEWYATFARMGCDPLVAPFFATWASARLSELGNLDHLISIIRDSVLLDQETEQASAEAVEEDMVQWLAAHPDDPHFSGEGKFRTLDDAMEHYRSCKRLAPQQIAKILGYMRVDPRRFIAYPPSEWPDTSHTAHTDKTHAGVEQKVP